MRRTINICLLALTLLASGCGSSRHPKTDPVDEAHHQISNGNFGLMGLVDFSKRDFWIPGVAGHKKDHNQCGINWHGVSGLDDPYIQYAEPYMKQYNHLILEACEGIPLDVYRRSPKNRDYIAPEEHPTAR